MVGRLTERDRHLCRLLDDHRVLTTAQVADVGFTGERRARMRLAELYALDVARPLPTPSLGQARPRTTGSSARSAPPSSPPRPASTWPTSSWRRSLAHDLAASQRLAHLVGLNGFFTALLRSARTRPGCALDEWWSERRCAREWGEVVRPDGYGIWTDTRHQPRRSSSSTTTAPNASTASPPSSTATPAWPPPPATPTGSSSPSPAPAAKPKPAASSPTRRVPVATAARAPGAAPDGAVWLPVDRHRHDASAWPSSPNSSRSTGR